MAALVPRVGGDLDALRVIGTPPGSSVRLSWREAIERVPPGETFVLDSLAA